VLRFTFETTLKGVVELKEEIELCISMAMVDVRMSSFCCEAGAALLNGLAIRKLEVQPCKWKLS
jgi:hypothetical protein